MTAAFTSPRSFTAYVERHAERTAPETHSGLYESVAEFAELEVREHADTTESFEMIQPGARNEWLSAGYALAIAYRSLDGSAEYPFTLAEYVEGDVRRYRFAELERAIHAGRLWAVGLI